MEWSEWVGLEIIFVCNDCLEYQTHKAGKDSRIYLTNLASWTNYNFTTNSFINSKK